MPEVPQFEEETRWDHDKASMMAALIIDNPQFTESLELASDAIAVHRQNKNSSVFELQQITDSGADELDPLKDLEEQRFRLLYELSMIDIEIDYKTRAQEERSLVVDVLNDLTATASELYDTDPVNYAQWDVEDFADLVSEVDGIKKELHACNDGITQIFKKNQSTEEWLKHEIKIDNANIDVISREVIWAYKTIYPRKEDHQVIVEKIMEEYGELANNLYNLSPRDAAIKLNQLTSKWKATAEQRRDILLEILGDIFQVSEERDATES